MVFYIIGASILVLTAVVYREEIWRNVFSQNQKSEPEHQEEVVGENSNPENEEKIFPETRRNMSIYFSRYFSRHFEIFPHFDNVSESQKYGATNVDQIKFFSKIYTKLNIDEEEEQKIESTIISRYERGVAEFINTLLVGIQFSHQNLNYLDKVNEIMRNKEKQIFLLSNLQWIDDIDFIVILNLLTDQRTDQLISEPVKLENGESCSLRSVREGEQYEADHALTALLDLIRLCDLEEFFQIFLSTRYFFDKPEQAYFLFQKNIHNNIYIQKNMLSQTKDTSDVLEQKEDPSDEKQRAQSQPAESLLPMYSLGLNGRVNQATSDSFVLVEQPPEEKNTRGMGMNYISNSI